jgi:hypothetical protein
VVSELSQIFQFELRRASGNSKGISRRNERDMGSIRIEVREQHLDHYPAEEQILKAFLSGFSVTWGRRRRAYNTELSVYFLGPEPFIAETFGFDQEVMLVYSDYPTIEPRALQAAESFLADDPARGRVEKLTYFFVSNNLNAEQWVHSYTSLNQESRLIIPSQQRI